MWCDVVSITMTVRGDIIRAIEAALLAPDGAEEPGAGAGEWFGPLQSVV